MNRLSNEKSPYLRQHKDNPVDWYPWGDEAFEKARRENKPIFLSIGYSTCYWCHVMEKDSFEREDVAAVLNEKFVSIKVDREERPDIDQIYMDGVVALTGHGGWPMSVFLTPAGKPFFGGTFFYRAQFLNLLTRISELWLAERVNIESSAEELTHALSHDTSAPLALDESTLRYAYKAFRQSYDPLQGGFSRAPKFPASSTIMLLLRLARRANNHEALTMALHTLERMARGGIYDQIGGGFSRYSTDNEWLVPHFEKMLSDNALLTSAYLEAYQVTKQSLYASVAEETLDYVLREMTSPEGGFYSAQDAGEVGAEGEYYVWSWEELEQQLAPEELIFLADVYGVARKGNFECKNILHLQERHGWEIKKSEEGKTIREHLLQLRTRRIPPHRDEKVLTSWNALMISAMAKGGAILKVPRFLEAAERSLTFLSQSLWSPEALFHRYADGDVAVSAMLEDYAYLVQALLDLYETTGKADYYIRAVRLQQLQDNNLLDETKSAYYFASTDDKNLILRKIDLTDNATPSGNSISALNLLRLFHFSGEAHFLRQAERIFAKAGELVGRFPNAFPALLCALDFASDRVKEVAVVSHDAFDTTQLWERFLPNSVVAVSSADNELEPPLLRGKKPINGGTTFYVCEEQTCQAPTDSLEQVEETLESFRPLAL